jgi:hypothetical protein
MTSFPEFAPRGLAGRRRREEQVEKVVERAVAAGMLWHPGILRWLAGAGSRAHQNEAPAEVRMPKRERLGDKSADRESKDGHLRQAERANEGGGMFRHRIDGVRARQQSADRCSES